jgi:hypothetical protein
MIKYLFILLMLTSCSSMAAHDPSFQPYNVEVMVRTKEAIKELGFSQNYNNARGLAWIPGESRETCKIMVPELSSETLEIWEHELRHCTEGYFHP